MENSYRALNIAFIDEWVNFSIKNKIDLNSAITEIKKRETHKKTRQELMKIKSKTQ